MSRIILPRRLREGLVKSKRLQGGFLINPYRFASVGGDPYWSSVVSLLHFEGTNGSTTFTDEKSKTWTAAGNAQISTAQFKFGASSGLFDGTGDQISAAASADFGMFAGNCTVEFFYRAVANTGNQCIIEFGPTANNRLNISLLSGAIILFTDVSSSGVRITTSAPAIATWHHVALTKTGTTFTLWVNGVSAGTSTTTLYPTGSLACRVGNSVGSNGYNGYVDELRLTKGVARYSSTFTPPAAPFPNS